VSDRVTLGAWAIDSQSLDVKYTGEESSERHNAPRSLLQGVVRTAEGEWVVLSTDVIPVTGKSQPLLVFQMQWLPKKRLERDTNIQARHDSNGEDETEPVSSEEEDSDDDDSASDEGSEPPPRPQSDHDTNTDTEDEDEDESEDDIETSDEDEEQESEWTSDTDGDLNHCLIIVPRNGSVHWHPWPSPSSNRALRHRVTCAAHPTMPLLAVTHTPSQLELLDLETWTWKTAHLPELSDLQSTPGASIRGKPTLSIMRPD